MKFGLLTRIFFLSTGLLAAACAAPRTVSYNEAENAWSAAKGTSTIIGRAWCKMQDGTIRYAHNESVEIIPANAYTKEIIQVRYVKEQKLAAGDPRFVKYIRTTRTDANGNFVMRNLPAGTWCATSTVSWHTTMTSDITSADAPGGFELQNSDEVRDKWVWNKVTVGPSQTAHAELYY